MEKDELDTYKRLKEDLEDRIRDMPNLYPYADLLRLLELAADVATKDVYSGERDDAIEELRGFLI